MMSRRTSIEYMRWLSRINLLSFKPAGGEFNTRLASDSHAESRSVSRQGNKLGISAIQGSCQAKELISRYVIPGMLRIKSSIGAKLSNEPDPSGCFLKGMESLTVNGQSVDQSVSYLQQSQQQMGRGLRRTCHIPSLWTQLSKNANSTTKFCANKNQHQFCSQNLQSETAVEAKVAL